MDLTPDDLTRLATMIEVFEWAGLDKDVMEDATTVSGSLANHLGVKGATKPRVLGVISTEDYEKVLAQWKIPGRQAESPRSPTLAEVGMAKLVSRACQQICGGGETVESLKKAAAAAASTSGPSSPTKKIKLSAIAAQGDDTEITLTNEQAIVNMYLRYEQVFGKNERPSKDTEPTTEQLSVIQHLLDSGAPPYTDFAIFGPYGHRIERKLRLSGVTIGRDGLLRNVEIAGPPTIGNWLASYHVLMNALVMTGAVDLGILVKYKNHVERLHDRYGSKIWAILYQADVRCRLELMERLRREAASEYEEAKRSGGTTSFDPSRPWNYTWLKAIAAEGFWREEVIEPGILLLTKVAGLNDIVDGDAKVATPNPGGAARSEASDPARLERAHELRLHPRKDNRTGRHHQVHDGKYTANRTGFKIRVGYNQGTCNATSNGIWCKEQWNTVHQCDRCLGNHPSLNCPHKEMPVPGFVKSDSVKKGKGKGKKGKGGRPSY